MTAPIVAALDQLREVDAEGAQAEIDGEFLRHVTALLDEEIITAAVDQGVTVRPRSAVHVAHVDVATGTQATGDRWGVSICHRSGDLVVQDALLLIHPPFSVATAAQQTAALCQSYDVREIVGDSFAAGFASEAFAHAGLRWKPARLNTSDAYIDFAAALGSGRVRLLDREELLRELRVLERRRGATRDRVDHRRGSHDDAAAATAGSVVAALTRAAGPSVAAILVGDPTVAGRRALR